jgi:hypothetical protein
LIDSGLGINQTITAYNSNGTKNFQTRPRRPFGVNCSIAVEEFLLTFSAFQPDRHHIASNHERQATVREPQASFCGARRPRPVERRCLQWRNPRRLHLLTRRAERQEPAIAKYRR